MVKIIDIRDMSNYNPAAPNGNDPGYPNDQGHLPQFLANFLKMIT